VEDDPDPWAVIRRAAACAVTKLDRSPVTTARSRSSVVMSTSGVRCTSPREIRLKDTSMLPAWAATASTWASTARSSVASSTATSADPPAARMSAATASMGAAVRPARKTLAPSRAKVRATPPPIPPPAP
jgi:hypothetical protein